MVENGIYVTKNIEDTNRVINIISPGTVISRRPTLNELETKQLDKGLSNGMLLKSNKNLLAKNASFKDLTLGGLERFQNFKLRTILVIKSKTYQAEETLVDVGVPVETEVEYEENVEEQVEVDDTANPKIDGKYPLKLETRLLTKKLMKLEMKHLQKMEMRMCRKKKDEIYAIILGNKFLVIAQEEMILNEETAKGLCKSSEGTSLYENTIKSYTRYT